MNKLGKASVAINSSLAEIKRGTDQIVSSVDRVTSSSEENKMGISSVSESMKSFKL